MHRYTVYWQPGCTSCLKTREFLRANGIEVLEIPGGELGRGRGGPRCMSCPISRAPLPVG